MNFDMNSLVSSIDLDSASSSVPHPSSLPSPSTAHLSPAGSLPSESALLRDLYKFRQISPPSPSAPQPSKASLPTVGELLGLPPTSGRVSRKLRYVEGLNMTWPVKKVAEVPGNITLGGLMMVHEREDKKICGPIMPQGGIQALEAMLHTIDYVNSRRDILPGITLGAYILDDCDKDTYGLEQSIDFIKGTPIHAHR